MSIRIDEEAASRLINSTEHAPVAGSESDYIVGLDVFHQLHCLVCPVAAVNGCGSADKDQNMIRQSIYPRRYNSSIVRADGSIDYLAWAHLGKPIRIE